MLQPIDAIQAPIEADMASFEKYFKSSLSTDVLLLDKIMDYIIKRKGKQIRPMFVFLSARMLGPGSEKMFRGASLIELLHTATLVHDDVVDDAALRRGFFSINALWKNKVAVLVGDYLLSKGLLLSVQHKDYDLLEIVSDSVRQMSEGELLQMEKARRMDISEDIYFSIIRQKTATLIASCCLVGAASSQASPEVMEKMGNFGTKTGLAFQIKDDLFDYGDDEIGKPVGIDIKEKKMTLPLIYALNQAKPNQRQHIINLVKNHSEKNKTVKEVIAFVKQSGGMEYAQNKMQDLKNEALQILDQMPDNIYRHSLQQLVTYTIERKK